MIETGEDGLPLALRVAWWLTAWARGLAATDLVVDAIVATDATHLIDTDPLAVGLGRLRAAGATAFGVALPVEGDPAGLGGPPAFNGAALEEGQALVVLGAGLGLVPHRTGAAVVWTSLPVDRRQVTDLGEADRELRRTLPQVADALADLDVAKWRPEVADRLLNLRHRPVPKAPDGIPERAVDLAARAVQAAEIVALALEDDGGAVSAHEIDRRRDLLLPLERAARHALVAAGSPEAWPE
ncbi:hypothetical protein [Nocardioides sp.]|uniref:hypothetical protein n=1 Tax=Nocardioides sp. TaxID=35761 RepID=UPI0039E3443A